MKTVADYYSGSVIDEDTAPIPVLEHILATNYNWTLDYIGRLSPSDFKAHIGMCMVRRRIEHMQNSNAVAVNSLTKQSGRSARGKVDAARAHADRTMGENGNG